MINLITENIDIWTSAQIQKNGTGRGNGSANQSLYGIKKLRELILKLAVRGKLVPQDPKDEPAKVLLEKISKEKARLIKEGKLKKQESLLKINDDEKPHELPEGWTWVRIGDIAQHNSGKTLDSGRNSGSLREYITTSNLYWGFFVLDELRQMPFMDEEIDKYTAKQFDLLVCEGGEAGRAAVWHYAHDICFQNHIHRVRLFGGIDSYYIFRLLQKMSYTGDIDLYRKGVGISNMSGKALASIVVPLPPIAEQHRIVVTVDELMAICDQLERKQTDSNAAHQTLVETLLATLTSAANPGEFIEAWQRIADHFDILFTTEQSIDQLKQTILQLAVMGKLVPQDPNDEPASVLLEKIAKEKARLVKEGKIKKEKPLPTISAAEKIFELPNGWTWVRWHTIALKIGDIDHAMPDQVKDGYPYVSPRDFLQNNGIDLEGAKKISEEDFLRLAAKIQPQKGDIIYPRYGTIGENRLVETEADFLASYSCCVIKTMLNFIEPKYQFIFSISTLAKDQAKQAENKTTQANVGIKSIQNYLVPLPPSTEQQRIVAKVNELMAICDTLKAGLKDAQTTQIHLADAIVEQAMS